MTGMFSKLRDMPIPTGSSTPQPKRASSPVSEDFRPRPIKSSKPNESAEETNTMVPPVICDNQLQQYMDHNIWASELDESIIVEQPTTSKNSAIKIIPAPGKVMPPSPKRKARYNRSAKRQREEELAAVEAKQQNFDEIRHVKCYQRLPLVVEGAYKVLYGCVHFPERGDAHYTTCKIADPHYHYVIKLENDYVHKFKRFGKHTLYCLWSIKDKKYWTSNMGIEPIKSSTHYINTIKYLLPYEEISLNELEETQYSPQELEHLKISKGNEKMAKKQFGQKPEPKYKSVEYLPSDSCSSASDGEPDVAPKLPSSEQVSADAADNSPPARSLKRPLNREEFNFRDEDKIKKQRVVIKQSELDDLEVSVILYKFFFAACINYFFILRMKLVR